MNDCTYRAYETADFVSIVAHQERFCKHYGVSPSLHDYQMFAIEEAIELRSEIPTRKYWKTSTDDIDVDRFLGELCDVYVFFMNYTAFSSSTKTRNPRRQPHTTLELVDQLILALATDIENYLHIKTLIESIYASVGANAFDFQFALYNTFRKISERQANGY